MSSTSVFRSALFAAALMTSAAASAQPPVKVAPPDSGERVRPQGFSVVLVLGDSKSGAPGDDNLPPAARKALADMKDFLPYKSYRLLDVQWILGSDRATTRLRGVDEQEYQLTLRSSPYRPPSSLSVMFQLQEGSGADTAITYYNDDSQRRAQIAAMQDRRRQLELEAAALREKAGGDDQRALNENRRALNSQLAEIKRQIEQAESGVPMARGRSVIDTSFTMEIGETVVVGTSRIRGGDKALIALLTAVPKNAAARKD